jgi:hypothetical protein
MSSDTPTRPGPANKGAATVRRREQERRAGKLDDMRVQIADGSLVIRQMTVAEHERAQLAASDAGARNQARRLSRRALVRESL